MEKMNRTILGEKAENSTTCKNQKLKENWKM